MYNDYNSYEELMNDEEFVILDALVRNNIYKIRTYIEPYEEDDFPLSELIYRLFCYHYLGAKQVKTVYGKIILVDMRDPDTFIRDFVESTYIPYTVEENVGGKLKKVERYSYDIEEDFKDLTVEEIIDKVKRTKDLGALVNNWDGTQTSLTIGGIEYCVTLYFD